MLLALIAALPFAGAMMPALLRGAGRSGMTLGCAAATGLAFVLLMTQAPAVLAGAVVEARWVWLPALGLEAHFRLDGLALLFAGLILGMGLLVLLYARFYLSERDNAASFLGYLMLFQGAMLGIVISGNILMMLVFWEMTSLASFLLIGFWHHKPEARRGAMISLALTGAGGLALIAGLLMLGQIAGSSDLSVILAQRDVVQDSPLYLPMLLLILLGAFTKSAQVPFQFWLPQAMAAPTPVSAYLHSATMVKAGIFLLARLWPVLSGTPEWVALVTGFGLATMLLGAWLALFKDDLKALLAYSTVSQLGLITLLLGLGTTAAAVAAVFHIVNHALFKAALFMTAGIVDHAAHDRSIAGLGGLARLMPISFGVATLAVLSMAGVPPLAGFLSKEMLVEEAARTTFAGSGWVLAALVTLAAALSVGYSLRFLVAVFLGPKLWAAPPRDPGAGLLLAPALLALAGLAIGVAPMLLAGDLVSVAASAVTGDPVQAKIALWHGPNTALWLSVAAIGGGFVWLGLEPRLQRLPAAPDAANGFARGLQFLTDIAGRVTSAQSDRLAPMLGLLVLAAAGLGLLAFLTGQHLPGSTALVLPELAPTVVWTGLVAAVIAVPFVLHNRVLSVALMGLAGLVVALGFAYMAAPDLALTQISVEVVTILLLLLALGILPTISVRDVARPRLPQLCLAIVAGLGMTALAYAMLARGAAFEPISAFHIAQSVPGAGGTNAVNTIIVDFRSYDTYGEIIVLGIAALVIAALSEGLPRAPGPRVAHPIIFTSVSQLLFPFVLLVAVHMFLRGHNLPGGGFVAGLVVAIALLMQVMASGQDWTARRMRLNTTMLISAGVLTATGMGLWPMLTGRPFLSSNHGYVTLPGLAPFELATAMVFDLGVMLCVTGAVLLALSSITRLRGEAH